MGGGCREGRELASSGEVRAMAQYYISAARQAPHRGVVQLIEGQEEAIHVRRL